MPNKILIRDIKKTEAIKLRRLFKKALYEDFSYFPGEYLEETNRQNTTGKLLRALISKHRIVIGLFEGRKLKGYAIASTKDPRESFIFWLYIKPELRGSGYGKKLMNSALNKMTKKGSKNIFLMTHQLEDFYKSLGFDTIYTNSSLFDDLVMYEMGIELKNEKKT
jgi:ribosomal protein S18 acetylase RimI-like enzyme